MKKEKIVESNFYGITVCQTCKHRLSYEDEWHSGGVCPHCGQLTHGTHCSSMIIVIKKLEVFSEKNFWGKRKSLKVEYIGKDMRSCKWIENDIKGLHKTSIEDVKKKLEENRNESLDFELYDFDDFKTLISK